MIASGIAAQADVDIPGLPVEVPCVIGLPNLLRSISDGDILIVDGNRGVVFVNPDPETLIDYQCVPTSSARPHTPFSSLRSTSPRAPSRGRLCMCTPISRARMKSSAHSKRERMVWWWTCAGRATIRWSFIARCCRRLLANPLHSRSILRMMSFFVRRVYGSFEPLTIILPASRFQQLAAEFKEAEEAVRNTADAEMPQIAL